ncbi:helix-turn-helix transcriptional regulator [Breznakia pachnodae]|uniref:DNA-binding XRE family transcriptional regulator n=1 Tax=Breznakia pachnodae TaxID=265178 RepID=A0ABU0E4D8_9FIRM|nr:helix-turn-helix transcriptional regulator [Breznakia pachnodae]MDQ0361594.1 DNA-binding XRE family transcriptional regulator [Breznakia pachnodae]
MYIKNNLKWLRKNDSLTRNQLGKLIGINESVIRKIESGERNAPSIRTIAKLCDFFEVSIDDFVHKDMEKNYKHEG